MTHDCLPWAVGVLTAILGVGVRIGAGPQSPAGPTSPASDDGRARAEQAVVESMSGHHMHDNPHLRLTTRRLERPGDRQRAAAIVAALRPALERYRDYHVALQHIVGL